MSNYWGYAGIFDCSKCDPASIRDASNIEAFVKELVAEIDMVAYGEPTIVHFGSGDKAGYSLVQLIETSNICAHFVEEFNEIYLDVFSCKDYDVEVAEKVIKKYFRPAAIQTQKILRKAPPICSTTDLR